MPLPKIKEVDYYTSPELHGNFKYVLLEDIINNYMMSGQEDDYTSNVSRFKVHYQAVRAFRELYFDVVKEIKAISLELSPQLNVVLPPDYINYVRISWVDDQGMLHPLAENTETSIAATYLQDSKYNLLFDSPTGRVLESKINPIIKKETDTNYPDNSYSFYRSSSFRPNKDLSKTYLNGSYKIDTNNGYITFGSEVFGKSVVLEYLSDGSYFDADSEDVRRINKFAETAVYDWIYWKLIERRRNVPANEKARARREWFNSRRIAKRRINTIRAEELRQVFRGTSKWIKGV